MRDPVETFRDNLALALSGGKITKAELHRSTKIARPTIDSYLEGTEPGLRAVGKIAAALDQEPWEFLRPQGAQSVPTPVREPTNADLLEEIRSLRASGTSDSLVRRATEIVQGMTPDDRKLAVAQLELLAKSKRVTNKKGKLG